MAGRDFSAELFGPSAGRDFSAELFGAKPSKERTWGEAAKDVAASVVSGAGNLVQLPGQLYGLATGNFADTGALGLGKDIAKFGEEMKSPTLKAKEAQREEKIQQAEKIGQWEAFKTAFGETVKDPALLTSFLAEQAPQLLVPFGAAKVAQVGTTAAKAAAAQGLTGVAAKEAVEAVTKQAGRRGTAAAIGAGSVQQGADVGSQAYEDIYKELISKGASETDAAQGALNLARATGAGAAVISLLAQRLPGAKTLEESFAGVRGTSGRLLGGAKGALGEGVSEVVEETGGKAAANLAMQQVNPEQSLLEGLGRTAGMAAVGGVGMGGVAGAVRPQVAPEISDRQRAEQLQKEILADIAKQRAAQPPAAAPQLEYKPEPYIQFPDGTVAKQSEVEAYIKTLPEDQQMEMRAKLLGMEPQPADKVPAEPPKALEYKPEPLIVYPDGSVARKGEIENYIQSLPEEDQISARAKLLGMGEIATQVTPEMLKKLGIRARAAIANRIVGLELTDPKVAQELTEFANQPYASPEMRGNIFGFLNTIKQTSEPAAPVENLQPKPPVAEAPVVPTAPVETAAPAEEISTETPSAERTITEPSGASVPVAGEPAANAPAARVGTTEPSGVVPAETDVGQPVGREEVQPGAVAPPVLDVTGIKPVKGRHPQVQAAAKLLQDKQITREEFEKYVDYYKPIEEVEAEKLLPPTSEQRMNETVNADKRDRINVPIADGTRVGLRMDLPARERGGAVVSIHEGKPGKATVGKLLGFQSTGWLKDVTFEVRSQEKGLAVAAGAAKAPQQTVEGTWQNLSPEETYARVKELMKDPAWKQISFDPSRHGYFYDRKTRQPVVAASEMYQVGQFLLAKDVKFAPKTDFLYSLPETERPAPVELSEETKAKIEELGGILKRILGRFGLRDIALNIEQDLLNNGEYANRLIKLALDAESPVRDLRHESLHAMKELGFFTDAQWKTLEKMARDQWVDKYLKSRTTLHNGKQMSRYDAYMDLYQNEDRVLEEAIADAFADFDKTKPPAGLMQTLLKRMKNLFSGIREAMGAANLESAEDIFEKVEQGKLKETGATEAGARASLREGKKLSTQEVSRIFERMVKVAEKELSSALFNWNDSRLNEDKDKIIVYPGRDQRFVRGKEGGKSNVTKSSFIEWLMSDAPFDTSVYGKEITNDAEWRNEVETLRKIVSPAGVVRPSLRTDTPEFRKWFKGSKAVDAEGKPLVVYHGGPSNITAFDPSRQDITASFGKGFYFTTSQDRARSMYALGPKSNVYSVYLSIKNPATQKQAEKLKFDQKAILDAGFDGIVIERGTDTEYVAFSPDQIKSTGNIGAYGQRPVTAEEARRFGMTEKEANEAQKRGDIRFSLRSYSLTNQGTPGEQALETVKAMGLESQPPEKTQIKQIFIDARKDPKAAKAQAKSALQKFADTVETKIFSADSAWNNTVRRAVADDIKNAPEVIGTLLSNSTSQAVQADNVANRAIITGGMEYEDATKKFVAVDKKDNFPAMMREIDKIAEKYGMTKEDAERVAHSYWIAKRLNSLDKTNDVLTADQIKLGLELKDKIPELDKVNDIWQGIRKNTIEQMVETGLWTPEYAQILWDNMDYVPFYREEQIEQSEGPKEFIKNLQVKAKEYKFKGSSKPVNDIFDNQIRWMQYALNRAIRNHKAVQMIDVGKSIVIDGKPMVRRLTKADEGKRGLNTTKVYRNGVEEIYDVGLPGFVEAFAGVSNVADPVLKGFAKFADMLRKSVVLYPLFTVSQLSQDSIAFIFTSGLSPRYALKIPYLAVKEFVTNLKKDRGDAFKALQNYGVTGVRDYSSTVARENTEIFAGVKEDRGVYKKAMAYLGDFAMAGDNAVRQAVYQASLDQGLSKAEAIEKTFEIFNVRRRGTLPLVNILGQTVPFFYAFLAAQRVAYRTLTGVGTSPTERDAALTTLAQTTLAVMALSTIYAMAASGDDDYEKTPDALRDRTIAIPGTGMRIPLRPDFFLFPKIIAERTYRIMAEQGTEDPAKFYEAMRSNLASSLLSPTPVPQVLKPLVEVNLNYDFFKQKPIISTYDKMKEADRQFNDSTSELAKLFGNIGISPINMDHFIRGTFGSAGGAVLWGTNFLLHNDPNVPRPELTFQEAIEALPGTSVFRSKATESSLKADFYKLKEEIDKAKVTYDDIKLRSPQDLEQFLSDEKTIARLSLEKPVRNIAEQLSKIRRAIAQVSNAPESIYSASDKRDYIKQLKEAETEMLKSIDVKGLRQAAMM